MTATTASKRAVGQALLGYYERGLFLTTYTGGPYEKNDPDGLRNDVHHYATVWFKQDNHTDVEEAVANLPFRLFGFEYDAATWHAKTKPPEAMAKAHVLRIVKGWKHETALHTYLKKNPFLCSALGFDDIPGQKALWKAWKQRFSDRHKQALQDVAEELVQIARYYNVPAPDDIFRPAPEPDDKSERTERRIVRDTTKEVWQQVKPIVEDTFYLDRGRNAQQPESAFWEQHTFMGMRKDMFAESGVNSFLEDTTRPDADVPKASNHRWQIRKHSPEDVRRMVRSATRILIARARNNSELVGELEVAIDITKGFPWTGHVERDDEGDNVEPYVMGYKNGELHFQWASIQIVGWDIPLVLDMMPVERGKTRREIVDELIGNALNMVDDISFVMMDSEFYGCVDVCRDHDVIPLTPRQRNDPEKKTIRKMREDGTEFRVEEQETVSGEDSLVKIFVPALGDATPFDQEDDEDEDDDQTELTDDPDEGGESSVRAEMKEAFPGDADALDDSEDEESGLHTLAGDVQRAMEGVWQGADVDEDTAFAVFQTTHPDMTLTDEDGNKLPKTEVVHRVAWLLRKYNHRWGIENGFRKIKRFMVRTTSKDHEYRFFNFAWACLLYNTWRLVDLLVQLSLDEDPDYSPRVDASQFLTIAKQHYGLGPPG